MKPLVVALVALVVVAGTLWLAFFRRPVEFRDALSARELATRALTEHLTTKSGAKRILVIANPFLPLGKLPRNITDMEEAGLRGIKSVAGDKTQIAWPELKPGVAENPRAVFIDPETTTPLSYLVATDAFDQLARQHPDCDLIVSLIGLPADLPLVQSWQKVDGPKFALLLPDLRIIGDRAAIRRHLESGKLAAFVVARPDASAVAPAKAADWRMEFERRFILVTRENFEPTLQSFPQLFPAN